MLHARGVGEEEGSECIDEVWWLNKCVDSETRYTIKSAECVHGNESLLGSPVRHYMSVIYPLTKKDFDLIARPWKYISQQQGPVGVVVLLV